MLDYPEPSLDKGSGEKRLLVHVANYICSFSMTAHSRKISLRLNLTRLESVPVSLGNTAHSDVVRIMFVPLASLQYTTYCYSNDSDRVGVLTYNNRYLTQVRASFFPQFFESKLNC